MLGPLQPVPPLHQGGVYGQELPVADVVIGLGQGKTMGQEGYRVDLLVLLRPLGEDGPDAHIRGVNFHNELARGLRKHEHRGRREQALEGRECALGLWGPGEGTEGEGSKWGRDLAEAVNEASVEVHESQEASELSAVRRLRPLLHCPHLLGVGSHLSLLHDVAEEFQGGGVEHVLLGLYEEPILQQSLEDQADVCSMFLGGPGKHKDVI